MIYIFTHSYPYARRGEVFLNDEMRVVQTMGLSGQVCFVPLCREAGVSTSAFPAVDSEPCLLGVSDAPSLWRLVRIAISMVLQPSFWRMPADFNRTMSFGANLKQGIKYFYAAWAYADWIRRHRHTLTPTDVIYSYWTHYNILGIALARRKGWLPAGLRCVSRGHGYDLYDKERHQYYPYRKESLDILDGLFPCSENGAAYMKRRYPALVDRIRPAFLGVWPVGADDERRMQALTPPANIYRVVSCSLGSPVKRLPLLLRSLAEFSLKLPAGCVLEWHHFGGGTDTLQAAAAAQEADYPHFKIVWHGQTENSVLREIYLNTYFHVFVNVSESEGLPVTLMEACAAGIPAVATDVSGNGELARIGGARLLPVYFDQAAFNEAMSAVLQAGKEIRRTAYACYQAHFSAERNYMMFWSEIVAAAGKLQ